MSKLTDLVKEVTSLNQKMNDAIVALLKEHNGLIRTDNIERIVNNKPACDNIYVISMQGDDEPNTEHRVLAVALIGEEQLAVLPDLSGSSNSETINALTDDEVLESNDWEWVFGGYVLENATLASICECIEQYV